jgi:hypothetical protein
MNIKSEVENIRAISRLDKKIIEQQSKVRRQRITVPALLATAVITLASMATMLV